VFPGAQNCDQYWIYKTENGWPDVSFSARTSIGKQHRETDEGPKRPRSDYRLNLAFVRPDRVGNDAYKDQATRPLTDGLRAQYPLVVHFQVAAAVATWREGGIREQNGPAIKFFALLAAGSSRARFHGNRRHRFPRLPDGGQLLRIVNIVQRVCIQHQ